MGWIEIEHRPSGEGHAEFFARELLGEAQEILAGAHVGGIGGTFYAAVRQGEEVWALIVATYGCPGAKFGWKAMEEAMGPVEIDCPPRVLDLLSATDSEEAKRWRRRCRERAARVAAVRGGTRVRFSADFLTPTGPFKAFEAVEPARALFRAPSGVVYRISSWRREEFEIVGGAREVLRPERGARERGEGGRR